MIKTAKWKLKLSIKTVIKYNLTKGENMVSKSALERAELQAEIKRRGGEQMRKEENAAARRGLFMLLFALIWGAMKLIFNIGKSIINHNSLDE